MKQSDLSWLTKWSRDILSTAIIKHPILPITSALVDNKMLMQPTPAKSSCVPFTTINITKTIMATSEKTLEDQALDGQLSSLKSNASRGKSLSLNSLIYLTTGSACLMVVGTLLCRYDEYANRLPGWLKIFGEPVQEKKQPASPPTTLDLLRWTVLVVYLCWMFLTVSPRYIGRLPTQLQLIGCVPERLATLLRINSMKADAAVCRRFDLFVFLLAFDAVVWLVPRLPEAQWFWFFPLILLSSLFMSLTRVGVESTA